MDPPVPPQLEQLALPLEPLQPGNALHPTPQLLTPSLVWTDLPAVLRGECHEILVRVLREVVCDAPIDAEDHP